MLVVYLVIRLAICFVYCVAFLFGLVCWAFIDCFVWIWIWVVVYCSVCCGWLFLVGSVVCACLLRFVLVCFNGHGKLVDECYAYDL